MNFLCHNLEFWKVVESLPAYLRIHAFFIGILSSDDSVIEFGFRKFHGNMGLPKTLLNLPIFLYSSRFSGTRSNTLHILIYVFV